jgi:hypothetical protein
MAAELKQIRIERTVGNSLTTSAFDLLPEELRNDYDVSWLREFSESSDRQYDHRDEYYFRDHPEFNLIMNMLRKMIADNVKFYFAVLFHIGRRLKIAELADSKIAAALQPEHLQQTFEANKGLSNQINPYDAIEILRETLIEASRVHRSVANQNRSLWKIWKKEIGQFREAFQDTSEKLYRAEHDRHDRPYLVQAPVRLMLDSFRYKELKKRMDASGFQVDVGDVEMDPQTLMLLELLSMDRYELMKRLELIRQENISRGLDADALKRQREQEISAHIQKQLASEFGDEDPFAAYEPLGKLPDSALYTLYNKCILPDNSKFYYAERWLKTLNEQFHYYYEDRVPQFKPELTAGDVSYYASSADSTIKRYWVEQNGNSSSLPEQRMQYSFEKKWIEDLVIAIRHGDKKSNIGWTLAAVTELIAKVVVYLNELGYKLSSPSQERLEKLWKAAKEKYYSVDW